MVRTPRRLNTPATGSYCERVEQGDVFVLATDGIYEHLNARQMAKVVKEGAADLDAAAKAIVDQAFEAGSEDNLTVQIVRIDELPDAEASEVFGQPSQLPLPLEFPELPWQISRHAAAKLAAGRAYVSGSALVVFDDAGAEMDLASHALVEAEDIMHSVDGRRSDELGA